MWKNVKLVWVIWTSFLLFHLFPEKDFFIFPTWIKSNHERASITIFKFNLVSHFVIHSPHNETDPMPSSSPCPDHRPPIIRNASEMQIRHYSPVYANVQWFLFPVVCGRLSVGGLLYLALLQIRSNALFIIIHLRETWTASESQNLQTIQYAKQNHNDHLIFIYSCPTKENWICNWILMDQMELWWAPFGLG